MKKAEHIQLIVIAQRGCNDTFNNQSYCFLFHGLVCSSLWIYRRYSMAHNDDCSMEYGVIVWEINMCGFIHDSMRIPSVCDLFTEAINSRRSNMEEALMNTKRFDFVRGAALMIKKGFTGVADGRREPTIISVEGDQINCMEGDGIDKPFSISRAEAQEFYDIMDMLSEDDMEEMGY